MRSGSFCWNAWRPTPSFFFPPVFFSDRRGAVSGEVDEMPPKRAFNSFWPAVVPDDPRSVEILMSINTARDVPRGTRLLL